MDEPTNRTDNRFLGLAIGGAVSAFYALLAAVMVVAVWTFVCIYAIVKWIGSAPKGPDPAAIIVGVVMLVFSIVLLIAVAVGLIGRSMNPKRRPKA
jgi:amino acid transporter